MTPTQTPLIDLLRNIPLDARLIYEHSPIHSQSIPVGRLAAESVAEIEALRKDAERYRWLRDVAQPDDAERIWHGSLGRFTDSDVDAAMREQTP